MNEMNRFAHLRAKKRELKEDPAVKAYLANEKALSAFKSDLKAALLRVHGEPPVGESIEDTQTFGGLTCTLTHVPECVRRAHVRFNVK